MTGVAGVIGLFIWAPIDDQRQRSFVTGYPNAMCTTKGPALPLGVAILLVVAGLAAHLLPPIHLMRTRRQQRSTLAGPAR
jgi:hypothetical protein